MTSAEIRQRWLGGSHCEPTFAMIKSHVFHEDNVDAVLARIRTAGFVILAARQLHLTGNEIVDLYQEHTKKTYWPNLMRSVSGPVLPMILWHQNVVTTWRELLGSTNPMVAKPGTLRRDFGSRTNTANNVAHGSDSRRSADRELAIFFPAALSLRSGATSSREALRADDPVEEAANGEVPPRHQGRVLRSDRPA